MAAVGVDNMRADTLPQHNYKSTIQHGVAVGGANSNLNINMNSNLSSNMNSRINANGGSLQRKKASTPGQHVTFVTSSQVMEVEKISPSRRIATAHGVSLVSVVRDADAVTTDDHAQQGVGPSHATGVGAAGVATGVVGRGAHANASTHASTHMNAIADISSDATTNQTKSATDSFNEGLNAAYQTLSGFATGMMATPSGAAAAASHPRSAGPMSLRQAPQHNADAVDDATGSRFKLTPRTMNPDDYHQRVESSNLYTLPQQFRTPRTATQPVVNNNNNSNQWTTSGSFPSLSESSTMSFGMYAPLTLKHSESTATTRSSNYSSAGEPLSPTSLDDSLSDSRGRTMSPGTSTTPSLHRTSPMARMRTGVGFDDKDKGDSKKRSKHKGQTEEQIKVKKQQNWKRKMKIAKEEKIREQKSIDGASFEHPPLPNRRRRRRQTPGIGSIFQQYVPNPRDIIKLMNTTCGSACDQLVSAESDDASSRASDESTWSGSDDDDDDTTEKMRTPTRPKNNSADDQHTPKHAGSQGSSSTITSSQSDARNRVDQAQQPASNEQKTALAMDTDDPLASSAAAVAAARAALSASKAIVTTNFDDFKLEAVSPNRDESKNTATATTSTKRTPKDKAGADLEQNTAHLDRDLRQLQIHNEKRKKHANGSSFSPRSVLETDPKDKNFIKSFVYELCSHGFRFSWHKEPSSVKANEIILFIKRGFLKPDGCYCSPRMAWCDVQTDEVYGVDLFEISALEKATSQHLRDYPFTIPARSIFIQLTRNQNFVFEAATEADAHTFVHGLRWLIARLSFNLVIGNLGVSCELFDVCDAKHQGRRDRSQRGVAEPNVDKSPQTPLEEAKWAKAMDDVTNEWVGKYIIDR